MPLLWVFENDLSWKCTVYKVIGPIIHTAQGAAQVYLLVSAWRSSHFPVLRHVVYIAYAFASICAPMGVLVWKQGVFRRIFGALLSRGTENRLHYRPTQTWSKVNGTILIFLLFKERVSRKCASGWVHNKRSICLLHTGTRSSTQTCQIFERITV